MPKYQLIIFDLDDTLFDYKRTEIHALERTCEQFCIPFYQDITYKEYKNANKKAKHKVFELISRESFQDFRNIRAEIFLRQVHQYAIEPKEFVKSFLKYSETGVLIKGVYETLKILALRMKLIVATNGSEYPRKDKINNSLISPLISRFYCSEELGVRKPNPEFFNCILKDYAFVERNNILVVGNSLDTDILGATNSNLDCCLFEYRKTELDFGEFPELKKIDNFSELINIAI